MATEIFKGIWRLLRKRVQTDGCGFTTEADGYEAADIEVTVDLSRIARTLGQRAMGNKSAAPNSCTAP